MFQKKGSVNQSAVVLSISNFTGSCLIFLEMPLTPLHFSACLNCRTVNLVKLTSCKGVGTEGCGLASLSCKMTVEKFHLVPVEHFSFSFDIYPVPSNKLYVCDKFSACVPFFNCHFRDS